MALATLDGFMILLAISYVAAAKSSPSTIVAMAGMIARSVGVE